MLYSHVFQGDSDFEKFPVSMLSGWIIPLLAMEINLHRGESKSEIRLSEVVFGGRESFHAL